MNSWRKLVLAVFAHDLLGNLSQGAFGREWDEFREALEDSLQVVIA